MSNKTQLKVEMTRKVIARMQSRGTQNKTILFKVNGETVGEYDMRKYWGVDSKSPVDWFNSCLFFHGHDFTLQII